MKNILVPTDFTESSYETVRYGIALAEDLKAEQIILYNAYQPFVSEDPDLNVILPYSAADYKAISEEGLNKMKNNLAAEIPASLELVCESDYNTIQNGIEAASEKYNAELILMNVITANSGFEEFVIGSTAVTLSKNSEVPVLVIPSGCKYKKLKKILLALDLKKAGETTPVAAIQKILDETKASLDILHIEQNDIVENDYADDKKILDNLFATYSPQYHFLQGENFEDAVNNYADESTADLIIIIPKRHGFFENIFKRSHTKKLIFHSHIPVLAIHE